MLREQPGQVVWHTTDDGQTWEPYIVTKERSDAFMVSSISRTAFDFFNGLSKISSRLGYVGSLFLD